jgi:hypothetical protein
MQGLDVLLDNSSAEPHGPAVNRSPTFEQNLPAAAAALLKGFAISSYLS